jgi:hypothetical protein
MRQLDVTDDQYDYLERVRETLEAEYLGPYGRVDIQDALQYLVDVHEATAPEMPRTDTEVVAAADARRSADPEPSPADAHDDAVEIVEAVAGDATVEHAGGSVERAGHEGSAGGDEGTERPEPTVGGPDAPAPAEPARSGDGGTVSAGSDGDDTDEDGTAPTEADAADTDEGMAPGPSGDGPTSGGPDRLQAMMNLLDTHDGKWREGDGDGRYEVDLPDGSTETVQTRDDVRAVLFKNYR